WLYPPVILGTGLLYTIQSLALFVLLPGILGTRILDPVNVVVAMTLYTIALLTRSAADGLAAVPGHVRQAATAMGYGPVRGRAAGGCGQQHLGGLGGGPDRGLPSRAAVHRRLLPLGDGSDCGGGARVRAARAGV